jgi:DNA polymerase-3 subunit gamma/tau
MTYVVTARKWRPLVYEDVIGQEHITTTLRNAIAANRLSHAFIFSGPRGVGKTTTARILAKSINCLHPKDNNPDNTCELCVEITENRSVNVFEIDGASNRGVEEIRNLREAVRYAPAKGKYKVYIIDEVHMLTKEAFNALLKTLEEPPPNTIFIFATTEIHKVPLTILSRCQRFDFRRNTIEEISNRLKFIAGKEKIAIGDDALLIIAKRADGSMRDAQSIFDQIVSFGGEAIDAKQIMQMLNVVDEELYFRVTGLIMQKDVKGVLALVDELMRGGSDTREFLNGLAEHFRNLLVAGSTGSTKLIETSEVYKKLYAEHAKAFSENDLLRLMKIVNDTENAVRWNGQPRLRLETGMMQMVKMDKSVQIDQLLAQLEELKKKLNGSSLPRPEFSLQPTPLTTDAPIRGNVKAGQPSLRADQVVPAVMPPAASLLSLTSPKMPVPAQSTTASPAFQSLPTITLSPEEASGKWQTFVEEARKSKIMLGTMLGESRLIAFQQDRLRIGCPDDFHLDQLKRNRQYLTEVAHKVYGAKVLLETMLAREDSPGAPPAEATTEPAADASRPAKPLLQHPVVQALIREFGAVETE